MIIINTTGYSAESILDLDDTYTVAATEAHDGQWKTDEQIVREIEQALLKGCGFIIDSKTLDRLFPRRD